MDHKPNAITRETILDSARRQAPNGYGEAAFICDIARDMGVSVLRLAAPLLAIHQNTEGGILQRADLVQAMDPEKVQRSEIQHPMLATACYHLVRTT